ncbi:MAG: hypothetical protein HKO62_08435 [Gammaproteobacteria bacterium]|nr:hypothetical protein [Gammaproteobacteria bacterium]NNM00761.1 hypothetical protein [Gammaproteobacteria bacterium]
MKEKTDRPGDLKLREIATLSIIAVILVTGAELLNLPTATPHSDALRYIDYGLNVADHGVFGLSPQDDDEHKRIIPGNANSPLYPLFLAAVFRLSPASAESMRCLRRAQRSETIDETPCPMDLGAVVAAQNAVVVAYLVAIGAVTLMLFGRAWLAYLAPAIVMSSTKPVYFSNLLLTETLLLLGIAVLLLAAAIVVKRRRQSGWWLMGAALAVLTLIRPEYLYLSFFIMAGVLGVALAGWQRRFAIRGAMVIAVSFGIVISPWLARNWSHFGTVRITSGYADIVLASRAAYNHLSMREWLAAVVFWIPDVGEKAAATFLDESAYDRLRDNETKLRVGGMRDIYAPALTAVDGDREALVGYLLRHEILGIWHRHLASSLVLAWRGVLASAKYLTIVGLPCLLVSIYLAFRSRDWAWLCLVAPAVYQVAFYALTSVSVARYDVFLIFYFSIAISWLVDDLLRRRSL